MQSPGRVYEDAAVCYRTSMEAKDFVKMDKSAFSVASLTDESDAKEYWHSRSPQERLEALERLRRSVYGHTQSTARLQRLLEVTQRP